eukprot:tig00001128_g7199.t1
MVSPSDHEQGGWPSEIFEPGEEAKAEGLELACTVCCLVMREPTLLGCSNEHALCRACAERLARQAGYPFEYEYMRAQLKCPIDREVIDRDRFRPAVRDSRRINELRVHCPFRERGCEWQGDLGSFTAHTERCVTGWGVCGWCKERVLLDELRAHEAACRRPCPNVDLGCIARLSRSELEAHLDSCLRTLVTRLVREKDELAHERDKLIREKGVLMRRVKESSGQLSGVLKRQMEAADKQSAAVKQLEAMRFDAEAQVKDLSAQLEAMRFRAEAAEVQLTELHVAPGKSIMDAVRWADAGQKIHLAAGVYKERVVLEKEVHIVGPREAILESDGFEPTLHIMIKGPRPAAPTLRGITIRSRQSSAVKIEPAAAVGTRRGEVPVEVTGSIIIEGCDIKGGASKQSHGIYVLNASPVLRENLVHDSGGAAIWFFGASQGIAEGNDVFGNNEAGIVISERADPIVRANRIHDQKFAIVVNPGGKGTIEGNHFERISDPTKAPYGARPLSFAIEATYELLKLPVLSYTYDI